MGIWLRRESEYITIFVERDDGEYVEVIRERAEGPISHNVTEHGIRSRIDESY